MYPGLPTMHLCTIPYSGEPAEFYQCQFLNGKEADINQLLSHNGLQHA